VTKTTLYFASANAGVHERIRTWEYMCNDVFVHGCMYYIVHGSSCMIDRAWHNVHCTWYIVHCMHTIVGQIEHVWTYFFTVRYWDFQLYISISAYNHVIILWDCSMSCKFISNTIEYIVFKQNVAASYVWIKKVYI